MMSLKKILIADVVTIVIVSAIGIASYVNECLVGSIIVLGIVSTDLFYSYKFYKRMYKPYTPAPVIQQAIKD